MKPTFVTRNFGKSGSEITKEEFIKMMIEDVESAKVGYREWSDKVAEETYQKDCISHEERRQQRIKQIVEDSFKKYKRESFRLRWVENEIAKLPVSIKKGYAHTGHDLSYLRWDIEPFSNGSTLISVEASYEDMFGRLYDRAINNKYFCGCTGWDIIENFSTEFKFHLSEKLQEEWKADEHKLAADIARFYEGTTYWGD